MTADDLLNDASNNAQPAKKDNSKLWLYGIGGLVAVVAVYMIFVKPTTIQEIDLEQEDYDLLNANTPAGAAALLANDTSPEFFQVGSNLTVADYVALGDKITSKWADRVDNMAELAQSTVPVLGAGLGYILAASPGVVTERGVDIWLRLMEQHIAMKSNLVVSCSSAIADIAVATLDGITKSTTCAQWTFVKDIKETKDYNVTTDIKVSESGRASSGLWGAWGSKKSSKTVTTHIEEMTHEERIIKFIPYCTVEVLDPTKLDGLLAAQYLSVTSLFGLMRNVDKQCPDAALFFKKPTP